MSTRVYATGRRKEAAARVWVTPGSGKFIINQREIDAYFNRPVLTWIVKEPLGIVEGEGRYDVWCTVRGGGKAGRRRPPRSEPRARPLRQRHARPPQEGRHAHARQPQGGAQEVRSPRRPRPLPVQQALIGARTSPGWRFTKKATLWVAFFFGVVWHRSIDPARRPGRRRRPPAGQALRADGVSCSRAPARRAGRGGRRRGRTAPPASPSETRCRSCAETRAGRGRGRRR
jgi:hypothetical protein